MKLSERIYNETKHSHKIVDKHQFVTLIRTNKIAAKLYINFNKICIYELEKNLKLNNKILQEKLARNIKQPDIFINIPLKNLLNFCNNHSLESEYMFKGGLIMGGDLLKKYVLVDDYDFLTFKDPNNLFMELKGYLDDNVNDQELFIQNVNDAYKLIEECFNFFSLKFK
jgi:hypothetical protein